MSGVAPSAVFTEWRRSFEALPSRMRDSGRDRDPAGCEVSRGSPAGKRAHLGSHRQKTIDGAPETFTTASKQPLTTGRRPDMTGICANRSLIQVEISPHSWHPARGIHPSFRAAENLGGRLSCSFQWVLQPNSPTRKVLIFIFSGAPFFHHSRTKLGTLSAGPSASDGK